MVISRKQVHAAKDVMSVASFVGILIQIGGNKTIPHYIRVIKSPILVAHLVLKLDHKQDTKQTLWTVGSIVVVSITGFQRVTAHTFGSYQSLWKRIKGARSIAAFILVTTKASSKIPELRASGKNRKAAINAMGVTKRGCKLFGKVLKSFKAPKEMRLGVAFVGKSLAVSRVYLRRAKPKKP